MQKKFIQVDQNAVSSTSYFKNLSKIQQQIILNRTNVKHIENGVNVSSNIGFDNWERQCQFSSHNKQIVKEILNSIVI
jgi:hypothetical protein